MTKFYTKILTRLSEILKTDIDFIIHLVIGDAIIRKSQAKVSDKVAHGVKP